EAADELRERQGDEHPSQRARRSSRRIGLCPLAPTSTPNRGRRLRRTTTGRRGPRRPSRRRGRPDTALDVVSAQRDKGATGCCGPSVCAPLRPGIPVFLAGAAPSAGWTVPPLSRQGTRPALAGQSVSRQLPPAPPSPPPPGKNRPRKPGSP